MSCSKMETPFTDENFLLLLRTLCDTVQKLDQFCFENGVVPSDPAVQIRRRELQQEENLRSCSTISELKIAIKNKTVNPTGEKYNERKQKLELLEVIIKVILNRIFVLIKFPFSFRENVNTATRYFVAQAMLVNMN